MVIKANVDWMTDPVVAPALTPEEWTDTRRLAAAARRHGSVVAWCVGCEGPMHPKELSRTHTRYFAHDPNVNGRPCPLAAGESPEHIRLKTAIYKDISKVTGWLPDTEVATTGVVDEETGRPVVVDVVAFRESSSTSRSGRFGWEVQLSPMDPGEAPNRQEMRQRWLQQCAWVSPLHYRWCDVVPWYQVKDLEDGSADQVVGGVYGRYSGREGVEYEKAAPFPASQMVQKILRRSARYVDGVTLDAGGWLLDDIESPGRRRLPGDATSGKTREKCDRPTFLGSGRTEEPCPYCGRLVLPHHLAAHQSVCSRTHGRGL